MTSFIEEASDLAFCFARNLRLGRYLYGIGLNCDRSRDKKGIFGLSCCWVNTVANSSCMTVASLRAHTPKPCSESQGPARAKEGGRGDVPRGETADLVTVNATLATVDSCSYSEVVSTVGKS